MLELVAIPLNVDKKSWNFTTIEEYRQKFELALPTEEYSIEFVDGDTFEQELFKALKVTQSDLEEYFETVDKYEREDDSLKASIIFLLNEYNWDLSDAEERAEEALIIEGDMEDWAEEIVESMATEHTPELFLTYFDYERYAKDLRLEGGYTEFEFDGTTYIMSNML